MSTAHIEDLRKLVADGDLVVVAGAGVAMNATHRAKCAGWVGLIKDGLRFCHQCKDVPTDGWAERIIAGLDTGDITYLAAAEMIRSHMKPGEFRDWLEKSIGSLKCEDERVIRALQGLGAPLLTTNYDSLIEEVTRQPPVTWIDAGLQNTVRERKGIGHIHGHWRNADSVVFDPASYQRVRSNGRAQAMLEAIGAMKSFLFVGFGAGLADPNFSRLLDWLSHTFHDSTYHHYRLVTEEDRAAAQDEHRAHLGLYVVPYADHDALAPFLERLVGALSPSPSAPTSPRPAQPATARLDPLPDVFGRDNEIEALVTHLLTSHPKPVPVAGTAGIGKSTVCLAAAHDARIAKKFGERRYFVRLNGAQSANDMVAAIANALGAHSSDALDAAVLLELSSAPSLLVLDNFETPWAKEPYESEKLLSRFASLLNVTLVVGIRGEAVPLGEPRFSWADRIDPPILDAAAARSMFLDVANNPKLLQDDQLDDLVEALGGLPLAIELVGKAVQAEPNLKRVTKSWPKILSADAKFTDSIEASIRGPLMNESALRLLSVLALFPDGVLEEDLGPVAGLGARNAASALRRVALAYDDANERLRLLPPIREYVSVAYPATSAEDAAFEFYADLVRQRGNQVGGVRGAAAIERLTPERSSIAISLEALLQRRGSPRAIEAAIAGARFTQITGIALGDSLAFAQQRAHDARNHGLEGHCLYRLGEIALRHNDHGSAVRHLEQALTLLHPLGDSIGQANCLMRLGQIAIERRDYDAAVRNLERALFLFRQKGNIEGEANCTLFFGNIALNEYDYDSARRNFERALSICQQSRDIPARANAFVGFGHIARLHYEYDVSLEYFEQALSFFRQAGHILGQADCILKLGEIAIARYDYSTAIQHARQSLSLNQQADHIRGQAACIMKFGYISLRRANYDIANEYLDQALVLYQQAGDMDGQGNYWWARGEIARQQAHYHEAAELFSKSRDLRQQIGAIDAEAYSIVSLGEVAVASGDLDAAGELFDDARAIHQRVGDVEGQGNCARGFGDISYAQGDVPAARSSWEQALELYRKIPEPMRIGEIHQRLARISEDAKRDAHVAAAREAWTSIDRPDLVAQLDEEFGPATPGR